MKTKLISYNDWLDIFNNIYDEFYLCPESDTSPVQYPCIMISFEVSCPHGWKDNLYYSFVYLNDF